MNGPSHHPLLAVGWSERVAALLAPLVDGGLVPARVIGVERGWCRLATPDGDRRLPAPGMVVGDWVALDGGAVREVAPRWSALSRLGPDGSRQLLAANLDLVLISAPADRLSSARVERELVIAWDSGAQPLVVLTKADVAPPGMAEALAARLRTVEVIATSVVTGEGLDTVCARLVCPVTAAFLGPSGAGKSTLMNALLGEDRLAVGAVRHDDHRGRHTTSSRQLVPLPSGGSLIDMPGLRSLGTDADDDAVAAAFPEIDELAGACRFADCAHEVEPGCAVGAAVAVGTLAPARLSSYRKLMRETAFERGRAEPLVKKEQERVWKTRTKEQRRLYREREA